MFSWLKRFFHLHQWSKWVTTKEFKYIEYSPYWESAPSQAEITKYGAPVLDQRRICNACGAVDLRRVFG